MLRDELLHDANLALRVAAQHLRTFTERTAGAKMQLLAIVNIEAEVHFDFSSVSTDHRLEVTDGLTDVELLLTAQHRLDEATGFLIAYVAVSKETQVTVLAIVNSETQTYFQQLYVETWHGLVFKQRGPRLNRQEIS